MQLGVATWIIDKLALRVGNEKSQDEADTKGTCTLEVENVKLEEDNKVTFDFLGKDSIRYLNTVDVSPQSAQADQGAHAGLIIGTIEHAVWVAKV